MSESEGRGIERLRVFTREINLKGMNALKRITHDPNVMGGASVYPRNACHGRNHRGTYRDGTLDRGRFEPVSLP